MIELSCCDVSMNPFPKTLHRCRVSHPVPRHTRNGFVQGRGKPGRLPPGGCRAPHPTASSSLSPRSSRWAVIGWGSRGPQKVSRTLRRKRRRLIKRDRSEGALTLRDGSGWTGPHWSPWVLGSWENLKQGIDSSRCPMRYVTQPTLRSWSF